jgi:hypothetical protein
MKKIALTFLLLCLLVVVKGQDFLTVPSRNLPLLPKKEEKGQKKDKILVREDSIVIRYDTLDLPFIDDFSRDHFATRELSVSDPSLSDTLFYSIRSGNVIYRDTLGFVTDSTFFYLVDPNGLVLSKNPNEFTLYNRYDISAYPIEIIDTPLFYPYNVYDTINKPADTIYRKATVFQDSARYYFKKAPSNVFYTDRSVYRNTTFAIDPPSIGVVTFDGLDQFGIPYNIINPPSSDNTVKADELTSIPLNLAGLPDNNVYLSFFYQPKGRGIDGPEAKDSLALDFYNPTTKKWGNVWRVPGFLSDTFLQEIIRVPDEFHQLGFRFRFRNYANSTGAFDQWHLDYIYLDHNRSATDTIQKDIAYIYDAPSMLKDYHAMPWFHFKLNPAQYMFDTSLTTVFNRSLDNLPIYNKVVVQDTNGAQAYRFPASNTEFVLLPPRTGVEFEYPINFDFTSGAIDTAMILRSVFDIDFRPSGAQLVDFIRSNDTVISNTVLDNYYAYDDGTAEAGYGVNPSQGSGGRTAYMAVEFNAPISDTLGGIQLYFLPQANDIRNQKFVLTVWNSSPPTPNNVVFEREISSTPQFSDDNGYITYLFDSLVLVDPVFTVGIKSVGLYSMNIGYDLNTNSKSKIFWSFDGATWYNPSNGIRDGSLMLRPVFRKKKFGVGIPDYARSNIAEKVTVYPNPAREQLFIQNESGLSFEIIELFDSRGRKVQELSFSREMDIASLPNGIYFIRLREKTGRVVSKKLMIQH